MKKVGVFLSKNGVWIGLTFFGLLFLQIYSRVLLDQPDGVYATHPYVWSDWSLHISIVNLFAHQPIGEWFKHHPVWSGGAFTYPFLTNLIPAFLMKFGMSLSHAMNTSALLYSLFFLCGAYHLGQRLTQSKFVSLVGISIFIFSSGHSGVAFWFSQLRDLLIGDWSVERFLELTPDPSRIEAYSWLAGNVIEATILPQRAMLLGMALGVWAIVLWYRGLSFDSTNPKKSAWNRYHLLSGLLIGLLPIAHMHTLIVLVFVFPFIGFQSLRVRGFSILRSYAPGAILCIFLYGIFIHGKVESQSFIRFDPFWTADGPIEWIKLWFSAWGVFLPLVLLTEGSRLRALGFRSAFSSEAFSFYFGFIFLFVISNFILFQPVHWDNSKIFFWCYFGLSFSVAMLLNVFWGATRTYVRVVGVIFFLLLISTGLIEVIRIVRYERETYRMTDRVLIDLGEKIRAEVRPREVFLTAPVHNHFISMWATQPIFLGYTAWAQNYGFNWFEREKILKAIFLGELSEFELNQAREKYGIRYIVMGPDERNYLPGVKEEYFSERFEITFQDDQVRIYDFSKPKRGGVK